MKAMADEILVPLEPDEEDEYVQADCEGDETDEGTSQYKSKNTGGEKSGSSSLLKGMDSMKKINDKKRDS